MNHHARIRLQGPLLAGLFAAAAAWPAAGWAQRPVYAPVAAAEAKPLSATQRLERRFLQITAANLRFQSDASQMAMSRSNNAAVKELAQALLERQKTAQAELLRLLHQRGMALPIPGNEHTRVLKQLGKVTGVKFDRLYIDEVVLRSYQADIANFEKVALQAEDPVLKAWIERQLPTIRMHAAKAEKALPGGHGRGQRAV